MLDYWAVSDCPTKRIVCLHQQMYDSSSCLRHFLHWHQKLFLLHACYPLAPESSRDVTCNVYSDPVINHLTHQPAYIGLSPLRCRATTAKAALNKLAKLHKMEANLKVVTLYSKSKYAKAQSSSAVSVTQTYQPNHYSSSIDASAIASNVDERATAYILAVRERFKKEQWV
ncbi:hypothetical protein ABZP36_026021 [Zizania latifolia]